MDLSLFNCLLEAFWTFGGLNMAPFKENSDCLIEYTVLLRDLEVFFSLAAGDAATTKTGPHEICSKKFYT
jgi:hypothetical protein